MNLIIKSIEFLRNKWIIQPLLLSLYVVVFELNDFGLHSNWNWLEITIIFCSVFSFWWILFCVIKRFFRDLLKNVSITTILVFMSIFFFDTFNSLVSILNIDWLRSRHLIIIEIIVIIGLLRWNGQFTKKFTLYLNILLLIFSITSIAQIITDEINLHTSSVDIIKNNSIKKSPDIYLIILDGYASKESLKKFWKVRATW